MSRMKLIFAALVLVSAISALTPSASAAAKGVVIASGSSALWQTMALAAYNSGKCVVPKTGLSCSHYTDNTSFELHDTRPGKRVKGTADTVDKGDIWIVWDNTTGPNVWAYIKVDSVVGNRCFFANPACDIQAPSGYNWTSAGQKISTTLWGNDTANPPANVQTLFKNGTGVKVNSAATDIRPEDAAWAECRVNSKLGNGSVNGGAGFGDGLDGLGYNTNNASGTCPAYGGTSGTNAPLIGTAIASGYPGSTSIANVLAFNISGHDPFTNATVTSYSVISVGASPITFVYSRTAGLAGQTLSASSETLQELFGGEVCNASIFNPGLNGPVNGYVREPLSGTMNTTEANVFRRPVQTISKDGLTKQSDGTTTDSQETGVGTHNPLANLACGSGGGTRSRGIGTGEEVKSVQNSVTNTGNDGVGYTFFSFGNVQPISASANYGYIVLDGVDPIGPFNAATQALYPHQELPACTAPCTETQFWTSQSFPNLRNGTYGAWSVLRMVANTASKTAVTSLAKASNQYAVLDTPDYVPALKSGTDPGLTAFRAHYQQIDGGGNNLGPAAKLGTNNPTGGDAGGDVGGCVGTISGAGKTFTITETDGNKLTNAATNGVIQIGIDTDVNGVKGKSNVSCSDGPDRH